MDVFSFDFVLLCRCYRCKNGGLFSGCFLRHLIKQSKKIPSVWKIPLCIGPERWCNVPLNFSLTRLSKASMLNYKGKLFKTAFTLQAEQEWLDYTLFSERMFFFRNL